MEQRNIEILLMSDPGRFEPESDFVGLLGECTPIAARTKGKYYYQHAGERCTLEYFNKYFTVTSDGVYVEALEGMVQLAGPLEKTNHQAEKILNHYPCLCEVLPNRQVAAIFK